MPQLNFFKLFPSQKEELISLLAKRQIGHHDTQKITHANSTIELNLYFSTAPQPREVKWIKQLRHRFEVPQKTRNNYSAVILIEFGASMYAVCYGAAHHFVSRYADWDFGISVAERLFVKYVVKNTRAFGGVTSKSIVTYSEPANVPFGAGEAVHYLKGEPFDRSIWGKSVSCGQSVKLSDRSFSVKNAHELAIQLELLVSKGKIVSKIPRSQKVKSKQRISELRDDLIRNMQDEHYMVTISDQQLTGVEFLFADRHSYHLKAGRKEIEIDRALGLEEVKDIVAEYFANDYGKFLMAPVEAREDDDRVYTKKMIDFIDYIDSLNNYYLQDGAWYKFDKNYLSYLTAAVDQIELIHDNEIPCFDEDVYNSWLHSTGNDKKKWYRERYLNDLLQIKFGYTNYDRKMFFQEGLPVEIADAIKGDDFVHVKLGKPQQMVYLVDQALASLEVLKRQNLSVDLGKGTQTVRTFTLWIFLDRATDIEQLSEVQSLIFLMKIANWRTEVMTAGLTPRVKLSYLRR